MTSTSTLTSTCARDSLETYENIKEEITNIEQSDVDLETLVNTAEKIVNEKFMPDSRSTYTCRKPSVAVSVKLDAVMVAMLAGAEECGGVKGKRYVASAIVACGRKGDDEDVIAALAALGTIWLTHLLFIFKTGRNNEIQASRSFYDEKPTSFQQDVLLRDGHTCVLSGFQDSSHPAPDPTMMIPNPAFLEACPILPRAIGKFYEGRRDSGDFKSAAATFHVLANFTRLPVQILEELQSHLQRAENGMLLELGAYIAFDGFDWCLKRTETDHVYALKIFHNTGRLRRKPEGTLITFRDHSSDAVSTSSPDAPKQNCSISLPNPHYIAIHATIAGIMHDSGAGMFFDELLKKYKDSSGQVSVQSWLELEDNMKCDHLIVNLFQSFQESLGVP